MKFLSRKTLKPEVQVVDYFFKFEFCIDMGTTPEGTIDPTDIKTLAMKDLAPIVKERVSLPSTEPTIEDLFRLGQFDTALLESKNVLNEKCTAVSFLS